MTVHNNVLVVLDHVKKLAKITVRIHVKLAVEIHVKKDAKEVVEHHVV